MTTLARLAVLAPLLLTCACSDDDGQVARVKYTVSYNDATTTQPSILQREVNPGEGPSVKQKLAFGTGELEALPVEAGYEIRILDGAGAARLRVLCQANDINSGSQSFSATLPDNSRYTVSVVTERASCESVK
ncbi:MAG: hypothetical protein EOO75_08450 [Myxococcales bacterium]|nr:MAG: hypothetical protein EOO75_08450 [Myxococcales bacterium]